MRVCPQSIINVGAASVLLRHQILNVEANLEHFMQFWSLFESSKPAVRSMGIAHMELADGEYFFIESSFYVVEGDIHRAEVLARRGHNAWRLVLKEHDIAAPTDDEIWDVHKRWYEEVKESGRTPTRALESLARAGNWR